MAIGGAICQAVALPLLLIVLDDSAYARAILYRRSIKIIYYPIACEAIAPAECIESGVSR